MNGEMIFVIPLISLISSKYCISNLIRLSVLALTTAVIIIIIHLLVSLTNIRVNLFQLYRVDNSEIARRKRTNYVSYSISGVHFAGYFIRYFIGVLPVVWVDASIVMGLSSIQHTQDLLRYTIVH